MLSQPLGADPHARWCAGRRGEPGAYAIRCGGGKRPAFRAIGTPPLGACRRPDPTASVSRDDGFRGGEPSGRLRCKGSGNSVEHLSGGSGLTRPARANPASAPSAPRLQGTSHSRSRPVRARAAVANRPQMREVRGRAARRSLPGESPDECAQRISRPACRGSQRAPCRSLSTCRRSPPRSFHASSPTHRAGEHACWIVLIHERVLDDHRPIISRSGGREPHHDGPSSSHSPNI
jgi:hypothetical protein